MEAQSLKEEKPISDDSLAESLLNAVYKMDDTGQFWLEVVTTFQ